ncbi:hypothetical protein [Clostridium sp.]|jgi:hypothetical protein|uniref:hypothetical protein n=1 Tax=Clostridium sp. TaxID=1506 RepID=UPI003EEE265C
MVGLLFGLLESLFDLLCLGQMLMMFKKAHKLNTDENYRNSIINQGNNKINENGELYTGFKRFKSVHGYIRYRHAGFIAWGIFAILFILINISIYIIDININIIIEFFTIVTAMIVTDYILYKRNKNVISDIIHISHKVNN